jgi:hypothetical protein
LLIAKQIFFETTDILSNELQTQQTEPRVQHDPNEQVLDFALGLLKAREVAWISDKKSDEVYSERIMETQNYSPVDKMINATIRCGKTII